LCNIFSNPIDFNFRKFKLLGTGKLTCSLLFEGCLMIMFNSLSYATKLVDAGVPREQAEVHAQVLQGVYEQEHEQYATKADFIVLSNEVKAQIDQLEVQTGRLEQKTDRLEQKTDRLEQKTDRLSKQFDRLEAKTDQLEAKTDLLDEKITQVEVRITAEINILKNTMDGCKNEFSTLRADIATLTSSNRVLTNSHKYILWIGGGLATMCMSVLGLCVPILLHNIK
jgi:predicted RNase H-like nuclease (RuvC/YqgF family)